jgi:hypothetical protein
MQPDCHFKPTRSVLWHSNTATNNLPAPLRTAPTLNRDTVYGGCLPTTWIHCFGIHRFPEFKSLGINLAAPLHTAPALSIAIPYMVTVFQLHRSTVSGVIVSLLPINIREHQFFVKSTTEAMIIWLFETIAEIDSEVAIALEKLGGRIIPELQSSCQQCVPLPASVLCFVLYGT